MCMYVCTLLCTSIIIKYVCVYVCTYVCMSMSVRTSTFPYRVYVLWRVGMHVCMYAEDLGTEVVGDSSLQPYRDPR